MGHECRHLFVPERWNLSYLGQVAGSVAEQDQPVHPGADEHQVGLGKFLVVQVGRRPDDSRTSGSLDRAADQLGGPTGVPGAALMDDYDLHRSEPP